MLNQSVYHAGSSSWPRFFLGSSKLRIRGKMHTSRRLPTVQPSLPRPFSLPPRGLRPEVHRDTSLDHGARPDPQLHRMAEVSGWARVVVPLLLVLFATARVAIAQPHAATPRDQEDWLRFAPSDAGLRTGGHGPEDRRGG